MRAMTRLSILLFSIVFLCTTFAAVSSTGQTEDKPRAARESIVIAALPFADSSPGGKYAPLAESMGDIIATYLGRAEGLTFVERKELNKVFKEHKLTLAGLVDSETKVKIGRLLGAKYILTGGVAVVNKKLKINAHLFEVETTRLVRSEAAEGEIDKLFSVVGALAEKLARGFNLQLPKITEEDIEGGLERVLRAKMEHGLLPEIGHPKPGTGRPKSE